MKVCIIGAGVAGLSAAKHCLDYGYECVVYEQTQHIGGTWNYTDEIGVDSMGIPIHTVMYHDLMTNLPKEVMEYIDFPYPKNMQESYLKQPEVLNYIHNYAEKFQLNDLIKFHRQVIDVKPIANGRWRVKIKNLPDNIEEVVDHDAIMICNGHYSLPFTPEVSGMEKFKGKIMHSSNFRRKYSYVGKKILVIGTGSSGTNISSILKDVANKVVLSSSADNILYPLDERIVIKPAINEFQEDGVIYKDGSAEDFDVVIFCTGYKFSFPFLSDECDVKLEDNYIRSLYKHIVNIHHPTMGFIGITYLTFVFPMVDIQSRFFLESLKRNFLPSREIMLKDVEREALIRRSKNWPTKHSHRLGEDFMYDYYSKLATIANIKPLPDVLFLIYNKCRERKCLTDVYKIIDDKNFVMMNN